MEQGEKLSSEEVENIRARSSDRPRRAENPANDDRRKSKPATSRGSEDQHTSEKVTPVSTYLYSPLSSA
ncbi:hypothetical protein T02_11621 [Trichinella nativa]|uniref:Uncharacterized protein n=1 Tax=Trichinella nativa TaxID=6335 RepID=A0A0V1LVE7_9BILA|nr:hypothetical protein T02_11621 [Trichinella nativa]